MRFIQGEAGGAHRSHRRARIQPGDHCVGLADAEGPAAPASQAVAVAAPVLAPVPVPAPAVKAIPTPAPAPKASATSPIPDLIESANHRAGVPQATAAAERVAAEPPPAQAEMTDAPKPLLTQRAAAFLNDHWRWIFPLAFLPLLAWLWAWHAHRSAYDEAGLPRGPKL